MFLNPFYFHELKNAFRLSSLWLMIHFKLGVEVNFLCIRALHCLTKLFFPRLASLSTASQSIAPQPLLSIHPQACADWIVCCCCRAIVGKLETLKDMNTLSAVSKVVEQRSNHNGRTFFCWLQGCDWRFLSLLIIFSVIRLFYKTNGNSEKPKVTSSNVVFCVESDRSRY